jgi:hypothetical protein
MPNYREILVRRREIPPDKRQSLSKAMIESFKCPDKSIQKKREREREEMRLVKVGGDGKN